MLQFKPQKENQSGIQIQPRFKVGQPGDKFEQEADRVADSVMRMNDNETMQMQPMEEEEEALQTKIRMQPLEEEEEMIQPKASTGGGYASSEVTSQINATKGNGLPLSSHTNQFMNRAFSTDFSDVKIHTGSQAVHMNEQLGAKAFTLGPHIYFNKGEYNPDSLKGKNLLAHELTHVVQQNAGAPNNGIQRNDLEIRSPLFEEAVTQISSIEAAIHGRNLMSDEIALARSVFGSSLDYTRINLIPTSILQWRTVGNTIRVPNNFSITDSYMAETFIHEMTHVWQYQHEGTSYISTSLSDQLVGYIQTGSRNAAYAYTIVPGKTFFEYRVEQQAMMVQTYFNLLREQANPATTSTRNTEITRQLALHQPLIAQMQGAFPRPEAELLIQRASQVMTVPDYSLSQDQLLLDQELIPEERRMLPITPILDIRFDMGL